MKVAVLHDIVSQGKKPLVKLTGMFWDESFGEEGMIARVTSVKPNEWTGPNEGWQFRIDYMEHKEHNIGLQTGGWYDDDNGSGTATETGNVDPNNLVEDALIDDKDGDIPLELIEDNTLLSEFVASGDPNYVEWLEAKLEDLVPNCMKTWGDSDV